MNTYPVTQGPLRMVSPQIEGLLNAATDGVLILDHKGRIRLMGKAAEHMFGCQESDILGHQVDQLLPDFFREMDLSAAATDQIKRLEPVMPLQGRRVDGTKFSVELALGRVYGIDPPRFITFIRDITDRLRREAALKQSEAALHTAQQLANIGNYLIHYAADQPDYASPQLRRMFGWPDQGPVSHLMVRLLAAVHPADRERVTASFVELESEGQSIDIEYRICTADTTLLHIHHLAQVTRIAGQRTQQQGTVHDITDRKLAEYEWNNLHNRIAHFGRISTMGEMAAGLAHEVNQPLTAIASYAQACRRLMVNGEYERDEVLGTLQLIAQQALRAGDVIRRLRAFARYQDATLVPVEANRLLEELVQLGQTDAHYHNVRLLLQPATEAPVVCADAIQIQQVLLNLMRNAIDAMLETPGPEREITLQARVNEQGEVEFMVADRGKGLPAEITAQSFNAFFTTKVNGMGLGLSISQSIVRAHGGKLWCLPNQGGGACFIFSLPRVEGPIRV